jgi:hypothetical protein
MVARPFVKVTMPELADAIRGHRDELHQEILARIRTIAEPEVSADPEFAAGTRAAIFAALDYAVAVVESEERYPPPIPEAMLEQARLAARSGVDLATVLRRYMAGFSLLGEAALRRVELREAERDRLLPVFSMHLDFVLARISEDYELALQDQLRSSRTKRAEAIAMLLAGVPGSQREIAHVWDAWHVGIVGAGARAEGQLRSLGAVVEEGRLLLEPVEGDVWAWVSSRSRLDPSELTALLPASADEVMLGVGEPVYGLEGWRRSHHQAAVALGVARRAATRVALYGQVGTLAAVLHDDLLVASLRDRFLVPLERGGRGEQLRSTLRGYLATECNVSATAAALGVSRRTVRNRLRRIEERVGVQIGGRLADLHLAMQLAELNVA